MDGSKVTVMAGVDDASASEVGDHCLEAKRERRRLEDNAKSRHPACRILSQSSPKVRKYFVLRVFSAVRSTKVQ